MNRQRKHYFTSFLSFFPISAEEIGRNCFFQAEKNKKKTIYFGRNWWTLGLPALMNFLFILLGMGIYIHNSFNNNNLLH